MKKIYALVIALTVLLLMAASASAVENDKVMTVTEKMMTFSGTSLEGHAELDFMVYQIESPYQNYKYYHSEYYCGDVNGVQRTL
jgi:opacity protein-like surface antigen